jgi:hypothetical protein
MVLFLKCVRRFGPSTKIALTAELSLTWNPMGNSHTNLLEFPIGSYVKLSSAVAAILVGGLK